MAAKKSTAPKNMQQVAAKRQRIPDNETPSEKFARLARKRMTKVLNDLRLIANLARYSHTPEQGAKIVAALTEATEEIESRFSERKADGKVSFEL